MTPTTEVGEEKMGLNMKGRKTVTKKVILDMAKQAKLNLVAIRKQIEKDISEILPSALKTVWI